MTTLSELKLICNYTERNILNTRSAGYISFIEMIADDDEEEQNREIQRKKRDIIIDAIINGKDLEIEDVLEIYKSNSLEGDINLDEIKSGMNFPTISTKIVTQAMTYKKYQDISDIYLDVMNTLEKLTSSPWRGFTGLSVNIQNDRDNMSNYRRIINSILNCSYLIVLETCRGPATTMIIGYDAYDSIQSVSGNSKLIDDLNHINIIRSKHIKSNKVILMRNYVNDMGFGINVVNVVNNDMNNIYFIAETESWDKSIIWFDIN